VVGILACVYAFAPVPLRGLRHNVPHPKFLGELSTLGSEGANDRYAYVLEKYYDVKLNAQERRELDEEMTTAGFQQRPGSNGNVGYFKRVEGFMETELSVVIFHNGTTICQAVRYKGF
jgi:hypothetical protein